MTQQTHTIAESNNFIVLDKYTKVLDTGDSYQSESDLERALIQDLLNQGYEFISVKSPTAMLANVRDQLQRLNGVVFNESEWRRFAEQYLDSPSDSSLDKTRKIHIDYICDFTFDDGRLENIYLIDKKNLLRNKVQVIQQFEQTGSHANRYDVTILVNGLPLVQIELKKRGVAHHTVVYSTEEPLKIVADEQNGRHAPGSVSFVPPVVGLIMAGEIIKTIARGNA